MGTSLAAKLQAAGVLILVPLLACSIAFDVTSHRSQMFGLAALSINAFAMAFGMALRESRVLPILCTGSGMVTGASGKGGRPGVGPSDSQPEKYPCLYPLPDGRRCLECDACQNPDYVPDGLVYDRERGYADPAIRWPPEDA